MQWIYNLIIWLLLTRLCQASHEEFTFVYQFTLAKTAVCAKDFKVWKWGPTLWHQSTLQKPMKTVAQKWTSLKSTSTFRVFLTEFGEMLFSAESKLFEWTFTEIFKNARKKLNQRSFNNTSLPEEDNISVVHVKQKSNYQLFDYNFYNNLPSRKQFQWITREEKPFWSIST